VADGGMKQVHREGFEKENEENRPLHFAGKCEYW